MGLRSTQALLRGSTRSIPGIIRLLIGGIVFAGVLGVFLGGKLTVVVGSLHCKTVVNVEGQSTALVVALRNSKYSELGCAQLERYPITNPVGDHYLCKVDDRSVS